MDASFLLSDCEFDCGWAACCRARVPCDKAQHDVPSSIVSILSAPEDDDFLVESGMICADSVNPRETGSLSHSGVRVTRGVFQRRDTACMPACQHEDGSTGGTTVEIEEELGRIEPGSTVDTCSSVGLEEHDACREYPAGSRMSPVLGVVSREPLPDCEDGGPPPMCTEASDCITIIRSHQCTRTPSRGTTV